MYNALLDRPKTTQRFASLMELYEQNYVLVRLLAPALKTMEAGTYISNVTGAMPLELSDVIHSRYTTTFKLTYRFTPSHNKGRQDREPDLTIRLYHDARTCEVMSGLMSERRCEERRTRDLDEGRRLNRFLKKWLSYCLRQGHRFPEDSDLPSETGPVYSHF